MANLFRQNPLALVLAAVATALVAVIVLEVGLGLWPAASTAETKSVPASDVKMLPPIAAVMAEQAYPETAARPLFTPTRRPAPAAPVAGNMVKGQFTLTGVIAMGDLRIALLKEKSSGKVHRVERGKEVNGMTLSVVEPERVTLAQGGDEESLTLQVQKGPAVAAGGAPGAAASVATGPFAPSRPLGAPGPATAEVKAATPPPPSTPVAPTPTPAANPAQRSAFGPFPNPPTGTPSEATPMTPEELLARRRARRGQQPNQ